MSEYSVILRKGEILVKHLDKEKREYVEEKKTEQTFSSVLQFPLTVEETTFGQFFALVAKERDLFNQIFKSAMRGFTMDSFIKECEQPAEKAKDVDFVEVLWRSDYEKGELSTAARFHGYGDWHLDEGLEKGAIGIEYTPLNEYKDIEIRLDMNDNVYSMGAAAPLLTGTRKFMVYDVIYAVLYEVTWAGDVSKGRSVPWEDKSEAA